MHIQLEESLEVLWSRLRKSANTYKTVTEEKRRMYGELLGKDKKGVAEVVENNKKIEKLMASIVPSWPTLWVILSLNLYSRRKSRMTVRGFETP